MTLQFSSNEYSQSSKISDIKVAKLLYLESIEKVDNRFKSFSMGSSLSRSIQNSLKNPDIKARVLIFSDR